MILPSALIDYGSCRVFKGGASSKLGALGQSNPAVDVRLYCEAVKLAAAAVFSKA